MPSPVLHEAGMPRARDHLVRPRGPSRFRACALWERAPVVHRLVKGTLHSRGLVAGRYQPLADDDTSICVARPCLAFCSRIRKRSETVPIGIASLRSRIEATYPMSFRAQRGTCCTTCHSERSEEPAVASKSRSFASLRMTSISLSMTSAYFTSTFAPASSSFFFAASASALDTPSLTGFGAPSTRSFASLRPRPVNSRTALMTLTLFSPNEARMTENSVCSSAAGAAAAPAGAATETAAAAETPNLSSIALMRSESSRTVIDEILSRISTWTADMGAPESNGCKWVCAVRLSSRLFGVPDRCQRADEFRRHLVQGADELRDRRLHRAEQLGDQLFARRQRGERGDVLGGHHLARHRAAGNHELLVALGELVQHFR